MHYVSKDALQNNIWLILNGTFNLQQHARFPIVQLRDLVKLVHGSGVRVGISLLSRINEGSNKLVLSGRREGWILLAVLGQVSLSQNRVLFVEVWYSI